MAISKKDVEYNAQLARLELSEKEKEKFTSQLSSILDYFYKLGELNLEKVEPIYQVTGQENIMREDEVVNQERNKDFLNNAPSEEDGFIKVKSVF